MAEKKEKEAPVERRRNGNLVQAAQAAARAVSFERILVVGLMTTVGVLIFLAYDLAKHPPQGEAKNAEFVLAFFKDLAIMQVGALVGSMRSHKEGAAPVSAPEIPGGE